MVQRARRDVKYGLKTELTSEGVRGGVYVCACAEYAACWFAIEGLAPATSKPRLFFYSPFGQGFPGLT